MEIYYKIKGEVERMKETNVYNIYIYTYIIIISRKINETQVIFEVAALTPPQ